jgi:hypothetical protein
MHTDVASTLFPVVNYAMDCLVLIIFNFSTWITAASNLEVKDVNFPQISPGNIFTLIPFLQTKD